ncbi:MAG TPA: amino acid permease [Ignavibacteria bacterium]|nr:amino acid permease [Ignavibacteria bacterium]
MAKLKRTLGLGECIFFGVGSILGAGIYTLIGKVAGWSGNLTWLAFGIASVTALFTAFSYAELSSMLPKAGGEYVYARKAFGKKTGLILGFLISTNGIISGATVSVGFAGYLLALIGIDLLMGSLSIIIIIFLVNASGIRESSFLNIIFTVIEFSGLVFVIYSAIPSIGSVNYFGFSSNGLNGLFAGSALAFFAYLGFEEIVKLSEETKNPTKNIPKALFLAGAIVFAIYTLVAISVVSVLPSEELGASESPLADVIFTSYGQTGVIIISIVALFSTSNTILSNMLGSSRVLLNMSQETKALKRFAYISKTRNTPVSALILVLIVMCGFALIGNIETIARIANIFIYATFLIVNVSVIVLRINHPRIERPNKIPFSVKNIPVISVFGIVLILVLFFYNISNLL